MNSTLKEFIEVLHNPRLPYSEVHAILSPLSGRILSKLENSICAAKDPAKSKSESSDFPALRIKKLIDHYVQDNILSQDRATVFRTKISGLYEVLDRFQGGLKGHGTETTANLLERYEASARLSPISSQKNWRGIEYPNIWSFKPYQSRLSSFHNAQSQKSIIPRECSLGKLGMHLQRSRQSSEDGDPRDVK